MKENRERGTWRVGAIAFPHVQVAIAFSFVAYEDLQVNNLVKNRRLAQSISDAAWSQFAEWLQYLGKVYGKAVVAIAPLDPTNPRR